MPRRACTLLAMALAVAILHGRFIVPEILEQDPGVREAEELRDEEERRERRSVGWTKPSGHYLKHGREYFPPSLPFPLAQELAAMEAQAGKEQPAPPLAPVLNPEP